MTPRSKPPVENTKYEFIDYIQHIHNRNPYPKPIIMRTNGLQTPRNGMQMTTWILFPVLFLQYFLFITPNLPAAISIPATILFVTFGLLGVYYGYVTTKTDSIDTKLFQHLNGRPHPRVLEMQKKIAEKKIREAERKQASLVAVVSASSTEEDGVEVHRNTVGGGDELEEGFKEEVEEKTKYCWVCQTNVYEVSMHCKYCDKCVSTFDHHCMWLNNCIGDANYEYFFKTVWFLFLFSTVHVVSLIIQLSMYFGGHEGTKTLANNWLQAGVPEVVLGFNIGFLVLTLSIAVLVVQLLTFHIGLRREKITTYQFIIRDGQKKRDDWHVQQKVKQKRGQVVKTLKEDGKWVEANWTKFGAKICTPCDPIVPMVKKEMEVLKAAEEGDGDNESSSGGSPGEDEKKSEMETMKR